ncbi:40s ribosomal protein s5-1 [Hordeum vulgare]|nr:40s ribosomal protein s5-1 [Hordeum vulgare]
MREGMLHIRDVEGPKKTGSVEARLEAMEQQVFKCEGMVERGLNANHMMITVFTNKHKIDANDIGKHLSKLYDRIDHLQAQIYDLQNQNYAMVQSNELMLARTLKTKIELAEKKAREKQDRWQLLKDEGLRKAAIEERRARATENKTMSKLLVKENRIMTMNRNDMDDFSKEWHDMTMRDILKRRMLACYSADNVFSSGIGTNVVDNFGAGVGTSANDGFEGGDDLDGGDVE